MSDDSSKADSKSERKSSSTASKSGAGQMVAFNQNIKINPALALPQYDRGPIKAFAAKGTGKVASDLIAFKCDRAYVPRWNNAATYAMISNPNIAAIVATGSVYWPAEECEQFFMIYEANWGALLFEKKETLAYGIKQDMIMDQFLPLIVNVLRDFHDKAYVHGGLRIDNLFKGNGNGFKSFIVGESLSTPYSSLQPALYEPIERAMADPIARGITTFADDMYAFGVMLTIMLRMNDPLKGYTDKHIIQEKIEKGSYAALTGKDRFTGAILEMLRGVLHDDKSQRWTIGEVSTWMDGQRLSPKQALKRKKASRVFHMGGERYSRPEFIAYDLPHNIEELLGFIEDEKLELWLQRSLEDKETLLRLEASITSAKDKGMNDQYKHKLVSRVSIALDPPAPIRYKQLAVNPEGIGAGLAYAFSKQEDLKNYADIIDQGLVMFWLNAQNDKTVDYGSLSTRFESCRSILKNNGLGFGLERCLYFLNSDAPCYSPKLKSYFVKTPEEMAKAFEAIAEKSQLTGLFLDRHSIAFLSVKDSRILDGYLIELNSKENYKNILGNVWAIANIQKRFEVGPLPHLAEHISKMIGPVLDRFHDKNLREEYQFEFDKIKKSGDLNRMTELLEDVEVFEKDAKLFGKAMKQYFLLTKEKKSLTKQLKDKSSLGANQGRTMAAIASVVIGGIAIMVLALLEFNSAGIF